MPSPSQKTPQPAVERSEKEPLLETNESYLPSHTTQRITTGSSIAGASTRTRVVRLVIVGTLLMLVLHVGRPFYRSCSTKLARTLSTSPYFKASNPVSAMSDENASQAVRIPPNSVRYILPSGDAIPSVALGTAGKGEAYGPVLAALKAVCQLPLYYILSIYYVGLHLLFLSPPLCVSY